jgi:outer membrane protein OmpA-like peptidoglycan-associated protein
MRTFLGLILIGLNLLILNSFSSFAKNEQMSFVLMKKYPRPISQSYVVDTILPMQYIRSQWSAGYHVAHISRGQFGYSVIMNGGIIPQRIISADTFPILQIRDQLALGLRITAISGYQGKWDIVMTLDNGVMNQYVILQSTFPSQIIQSYWKKGYRIGVLDYINGYWVLSMNRTMFSSAQSYAIHDSIPIGNFDTFLKGYALRECKQIEDKYLFIMEGNSSKEDVIRFSGKQLTKQAIDSAWERGYALCAMQMYKPINQHAYWLRDSIIEISSLDINALPQDSLSHAIFDRHIMSCNDCLSSTVAMKKRIQGYLMKKDTSSAIAMYAKYKTALPTYKAWIDSSLAMLANPMDSIQKINLGSPINTSGSEWDPVPSPDGQSLYLSVRDRRGGEGRQDVFVAERSDSLLGGMWKKPISIGKGVNSQNGEETIDNVSTDGNTLFLSGTFPGTYGKFDIYTAERTPDGWDNLRQMPRPINSEYHDESGCLSSDGKVLLFSSDRPGAIGDLYVPMNYRFADGTHGNMDLWASIKTDTGWSEPINLGDKINTPFSERSLYLHPDGRTLYFSSNGHPGMGGLDVFVSYRLKEDSWTDWTVPKNMGRAINTIDDDFSYKITVSGDTAYYAAQDAPDGLGQWDVYRVIIPKNVRPQPIASLSGKVLDKLTKKPISASIIWEDLQTGKKVGSSTVNPNDGSYFIVLPLGKKYGYYASADGYYPSSSNIDLKKQQSALSKKYDIQLSAIPASKEKELTVELSNVFFDYGSAQLLEESQPELRRLATIIKEQGYTKILISGHTDDIGSDAFNDRLSLLRANAVKNYLITLGLSRETLQAKGFGKRKPRSFEKTAEANAENRRVEVTISGR